MIRALLFSPINNTVAHGDEALLDRWTKEDDTLLWIDFAEHDPLAEATLLASRFGLHRLAIRDAQRDRHPPKIEVFPNSLFILLKGLATTSEVFDFRTLQLAMFLGPRFLITRHAKPSPTLDALREEVDLDPSLLGNGVDALALRLCRILVDRYTKALLALEPRLDDLEGEIVTNPDDSMLAELIGYKTDLRKFRRVLVYHVQIFDTLMRSPPPQISADRVHELRDVYEHQERASSLAALYYEVSSDFVDGYLSLASHRLNRIIQVLTIVTTIFVPLSFLAGVYGMNFAYMPELQSRAGYFVLLGIMATIATVLVLAFRRQRWL